MTPFFRNTDNVLCSSYRNSYTLQERGITFRRNIGKRVISDASSYPFAFCGICVHAINITSRSSDIIHPLSALNSFFRGFPLTYSKPKFN